MFEQRLKATDVEEVIEYNVKMPVSEFLEDVRFPFIKNMREAVALAKKYLAEHPGCTVYIIGDYDTDGLLASTNLEWAFKRLGVNVKIRIPRRMSEGYGLKEKIIDEIDDGLVITVDNGIAAKDAIQKAKDKGLTVIVIDHHLAPRDEDGNMILPPADVIVDPHIEEESEFKMFCGAALAYFFAKEMFPDANLYPLLVLASIATVADVMPLVGANRTLVKDGLELINARKNVPGLNAIIDAKELTVITEEDFGFLFGPIFNAAGRLYDNGGTKVLNVLCSSNTNPALKWQVKELIEINEKRKSIVKESMVIADNLVTDERPIVIYHPSFGEGIVGIISGQLTERYNTPSIVFTLTPNGVYKGSARSTENIHLKNALDKMQSTMLGYGGHAGAAGVSVSPEEFDNFKNAFIENVGTEHNDSDALQYDLEITENDIESMAMEVEKFAPYGEGNPKVRFHLKLDVTNGSYAVMGDGTHFCITMDDYKVMGFGLVSKYEAMGMPKKMEVVCYISYNWYGGQKAINVELIDFIEI